MQSTPNNLIFSNYKSTIEINNIETGKISTNV